MDRPRHRARHLLLLAALLLALAAWLQPPFVGAAQRYNQAVAASALVAYAGLRTINATISTAKEVQVSVPIIGGLEAKPGMVLDPVDETVARISNAIFLMMTLTAVLALAFAPVAKVGAALAAAGFLGLWCAGSVRGLGAIGPASRAAATAGVVLALVLPGSFAGGGWLGEYATQRTLQDAQAALISAGSGAPDPAMPAAERGWWPFGRSAGAEEQAEVSRNWFMATVDDYTARAETILESSLTILAVYALRLVLLPALILGLVVAVLRGALRTAVERRG